MEKFVPKILLAAFFLVCLSVSASAASGYIVKLKDGFCPSESRGLTVINEECRLYYAESEDSLEPIKAYAEAVSPNYEIEAPEPILEPSLASDSYYSKQWAIEALKADAPWELETYGNDIRIAVIDSGCANHSDLYDNVLPGQNYYVTVPNNFGDFSDVSPIDVTDNIGHGTHVSGIIAAISDNGIGIKGIASKAKIVPLKCFENGYGTSIYMLITAICDAVDKYDCKIINMSWTSDYNTGLLQAAIDYAYSKGAILVAAAGNSGNSTVYYPAGYSNVIGVGSINSDKSKSSFSNFNESVTVTAPGASIMSTYPGGYASASGTSQATPMISALAAIALSAKPDLTNAEFTEIITSTAEDLGNEGYDYQFGYGLADAKAMMEKLLDGSEGYISPVNYENGIPHVLIKNTTASKMEYLSGFAGYSSNKMTFCNVCPVSLDSGKSCTVSGENMGENPSAYLWQKSNLSPLWYKR